MSSYYKIKYDTMIFSDIRIDQVRNKIKPIFDLIEIVGTINEAPKESEEEVKKILDFYKLNQPESYEKILRYYSPKYTLKNVEKFYKKLQDCRHKMEAVGYSLFLLKNEIKNFENISIEEIKKTLMISMCPKTEFKNDILIFETESFLFQVKSGLDILIQALKYVYTELEDIKKNYDNEDFKICNNTTSILTKLKNGGHKTLADYLESEYNLWIKDLIKLRNTITHRSGLENFFCFMLFYEINTLEKPKMPSGEYVDMYCENTYNNLLKLYETIFKDFLLFELKDKMA